MAVAASGDEALERLAAGDIDLVLLDVVMPGIDGYEVCRRVRADPATAFLPVVMITASGEQEKRRAIEAGADDFVTKPFDQAELLARVRSLLRVKRYHDEIEAYNRGLRSFLPPQVAELVKGDPSVLESHRREIAVLACSLHGFAAFAESAEPEDVMTVLGSYHEALGALVSAAEGTLARLTGDGLLVVFNDPLPCAEPAGVAVRLALAMRDRVWELAEDVDAARLLAAARLRRRARARDDRPDRVRAPLGVRAGGDGADARRAALRGRVRGQILVSQRVEAARGVCLAGRRRAGAAWVRARGARVRCRRLGIAGERLHRAGGASRCAAASARR